MTIMCDAEVRELNAIEPYFAKSHACGMSYGESSFGYDLRMGDTVKVLSQRTKDKYKVLSTVNPPEDDLYATYVIRKNDYFVLKPHSRCLVATLETIHMPKNCVAITKPKSTLSRFGLEVASVVIEPDWTGNITLELFNHTDRGIALYAGMPICQLMFWEGYSPDAVYNGKYQGDMGISLNKAEADD